MGHIGKSTMPVTPRIVDAYTPPAPLKCAESQKADDILGQMENDAKKLGGEILGVYNDLDIVFVSHLANNPILPGSVVITIDDADFVHPTFDNAKGFLLGSRYLNGTIDYNSGRVQLFLTHRAHGKTIRAQYATHWESAPKVEVIETETLSRRFLNWIRG